MVFVWFLGFSFVVELLLFELVFLLYLYMLFSFMLL